MVTEEQNQQFMQFVEHGKFDHALLFANDLSSQFPDHAQSYKLMGDAFLMKDDSENAIRCYQYSLSLHERQPSVYLSLGKIYELLLFQSDALNVYTRALELAPNSGYVNFRSGDYLSSQGFFKEAEELISTAIRLGEKRGNFALLSLYERQGNTKAIKKLIKKRKVFFEQNSSGNDVLPYLSALSYIQQHETLIQFAKIINTKIKSQSWLRVFYNYIANAHHELGQYNKAFKAYEAQNNCFSHDYDKHQEQQNHDFTLAKIKELVINQNLQAKTIKPIFIVGMPRSGTSLIERIINTNKTVSAGGELGLINVLFEKLLSEEQNLEQNLEWYQQQLEATIQTENDLIQWVTDKMPSNYVYIGLILKLYPEAKIIWCQRDPIDVAFSIFKQNFTERMIFANNFSSIAHTLHIQNNLFQYWKSKYSKNIYTLEYEQLVKNIELETKAVFKFLELEWSESVNYFHTQKSYMKTASSKQVKQPINTKGLATYQPYLEYLKPLINELEAYKIK